MVKVLVGLIVIIYNLVCSGDGLRSGLICGLFMRVVFGSLG